MANEQKPDRLDRATLTLVLDAWRGRPVDREKATVAAIRVGEHVVDHEQATLAGLRLDQRGPITNEDVAVAFTAAALQTEEADHTVATPDAWAIVQKIAAKVIERFKKVE